MVIVESGVWIDYFRDIDNPQTLWLRANLESQIGLLDLILCEVLQGARTPTIFRNIRQTLSLLPIDSLGGTELMIAAAENYRILRARGLTVRSTIDCIIATHCIQQGHQLLHKDGDFDGFEMHLGLLVVNA